VVGVKTAKAYICLCILVVLLVLSGCDGVDEYDTINNEYEILTPANQIETKKNSTDDSIIIQDLFEPKDMTIYIEGVPVLIRHYPFGEISSIEGIASYVIFIEEIYHVEQRDNLLRAIWDDTPEYLHVFMEIKQVPNITVIDMEQKIITYFEHNHYLFLHSQATEYFPFVRLGFYGGTDLIFEWDSVVINIYIKDNTQGGVFVITTHYFFEAAGGHSVRFINSLKTIEILD